MKTINLGLWKPTEFERYQLAQWLLETFSRVTIIGLNPFIVAVD